MAWKRSETVQVVKLFDGEASSPEKNPVRCFASWLRECKLISSFPVGENRLQHRQEIGYVILNTSIIVDSLFLDSVATQNVNGLTEKKLEDFQKWYWDQKMIESETPHSHVQDIQNPKSINDFQHVDPMESFGVWLKDEGCTIC